MTPAARTKPPLKWPGGKFKLVPAIAEALGGATRLVEPFAGSCAVFLNTEYPEYLLCDANRDLVAFHTELSRDAEDFMEECRALFADGNDREIYLRRRARFNSLADRGEGECREKAALFLYLNRFCYNGLVRYNSRNRFNVPFGKYRKPYFPEAEMRAFAAKAARGEVVFRAADFRETLRAVKPGDAVYCDPPYFPLSQTANFTAYSGNAFGITEQEELASLAQAAAARGARCVVSNHDLPAVRDLYAGARRFIPLHVRRSISCATETRAEVAELMIIL